MKVSYLRKKLQDAIDMLEGYDDDQEIKVHPNTYFLRNSNYFLGTNHGYIDLNDPVADDEDY